MKYKDIFFTLIFNGYSFFTKYNNIKKFVFINIFITFVYNNKQMKTKQQILFPKQEQLLAQMGEQLKLARKRRKLSTLQTSERAGVSRTTLYLIEKGDSRVSIGAYCNVLRVLGLQNDILKIADDDELGRKLQDLELL